MTKLKSNRIGYLCEIEGEKIFVVAVNVANAMDKLEEFVAVEYGDDIEIDYAMLTHHSIIILE